MLGREICLSEGQRLHWTFCDGLESTDENVRKTNVWKTLPFPLSTTYGVIVNLNCNLIAFRITTEINLWSV